jgi:hypothetical protein
MKPRDGKTTMEGGKVRVYILKITQIVGRARLRAGLFVITASAFLLIGPAAAGAQQVTDAQYNSTLQLLQSGGQPPSSPPSNGLPFTGLDVVALFAVGAALAAAGFLLWRRSRVQTTQAGA